MNDTLESNSHHQQKSSTKVLTPVVWCILVAETGERFAYFGFRAILVLYFVHDLQLEETQAISAFAYTTCLAYFSPLFGALLADGQLGRYKTILYCSILYIVGLAILTAAAWGNWELSFKRLLTLLGLVLVCLGTGGIKPCVSAFGADQVALNRSKSDKDSSHTFRDDHPSEQEDPDGLVVRIRKGDENAAGESDQTAASEETSQRVRAFFSYFYFCINVGAVVSIACVPIVRGFAGFGPAFSVSLWFMIIAIALFSSKKQQYIHLVPGEDGSSLSMTLKLCWWLFRQNLWTHSALCQSIPGLKPGPRPQRAIRYDRIQGSEEQGRNATQNGDTTIDESDENVILDQQLSDASQVLHVLPIMAAFPIFWCLYDQQSSVWTLQATKMNLHGLQPEQLNVVNPVEIMILIPLFERIIYPLLQNLKWNISPLRRVLWGMLFAATSFSASGFVETWIEDSGEGTVSVFWQLPQITILAVAEICVSVTGLEFAYSCAPVRVKALLLSLFLLTTATGNMLSGVLYSTIFADMDRAVVMHVCATLMLVNCGAFFFLSRWWERRDASDLHRAIQSNEEIELS